MFDDNTVELVLTADGNTKNIVFIEELVASAPNINGWKFTALKQALNIEDVSIEMAGLKFNFIHSHHMLEHTYNVQVTAKEIVVCIIHNDMNDDNRQQIINGVYIF